MVRKKIAKLATFLTVLVAFFFFTRHGDQNGRSLERWVNYLELVRRLDKPQFPHEAEFLRR